MRGPRTPPILNRRLFLITSTQLALGLMVNTPINSFARLVKATQLTFYHTHTRETISIPHIPGKCLPKTQEQVDNFLRDFRTGEKHCIDSSLLDTLACIKNRSNTKGVFEVISGYRSPSTNQYLRRMSHGVAKKSLHMQGKAIDVRMNGFSTRKLRDVAIGLGHGGVGYYAKSDFIHLDTGRFRIW